MAKTRWSSQRWVREQLLTCLSVNSLEICWLNYFYNGPGSADLRVTARRYAGPTIKVTLMVQEELPNASGLQEASQKLEPKKKEHLSRKPHAQKEQEHECSASSTVSTLKDCRCAHALFISSTRLLREHRRIQPCLTILCDSVLSDDLNMSHMVKNLIGRFVWAGKRPFIIRRGNNHF